MYEILNGPGAHGVDDLYTPEIGSNFDTIADRNGDKITASIARTERYDANKVHALLNEIRGLRHDGKAPAPTAFGLNLQAINGPETRRLPG
ncbi:MAG: hypothetical protein ACYDDO_01595 [Acidiferrobacterales bacterium]